MKQLKLILFLTILCGLSENSWSQEKYLEIGNGGGFSGAKTIYKLLPDGNVYKGMGTIEIKYSHHGKLKRSSTRRIFARLNNLGDSSFSHPGNMYYFITVYDQNSEIKYVWGAHDFDVPEAISNIYTQTLTQLTQINFKEIIN